MKVLLLGTGMQGKAALHDLATDPAVTRIVAADRDLFALRSEVRDRGYGEKVVCETLDAADHRAIEALVGEGHDVVIDLLPVPYIGRVAAAAVVHKVHLVNTFYVVPDLAKLDRKAARAGITILPEFGMDPGIDLVMLGDMVRSFDEVDEILSYGAGIPEPEAADNSIRYKVSWTFEGVLRSYMRSALLIENGDVVELTDRVQFRPENLHYLELPGVGILEAFPNGNAVAYVKELGLDPAKMRKAGRYAMRYPGHGAFWATMVDLGLLDDATTTVDGVAVNHRRYLASVLEPRLQYRPKERDLSIIRVEVAGRRGRKRVRMVREVIDRRDLSTGLTAMSRTVGYTAAIGARMILDGTVSKRGIVSPVTDVPYAPFVKALAARGITIEERLEKSPA